GAKLVRNVEDILSELNLETTSSQAAALQAAAKSTLPETCEEAAIYNLLSGDPQFLDEVIRLSGRTAASVCASLTVLEMKGMVKNVGSNQFCRV
ncbi:MAG: DNA-protecting protein DprA, partial [bacterium]|nr:DNA-protecting protein DprA [bacterium]